MADKLYSSIGKLARLHGGIVVDDTAGGRRYDADEATAYKTCKRRERQDMSRFQKICLHDEWIRPLVS